MAACAGFFFIMVFQVHIADAKDSSRAEWMRGSWGVRIILPAGERYELYHFKVQELISQLKSLKSVSWVMLNLTNENDGAHFTGPNILLEEIDANMAPSRDLLGEVALGLSKIGIKTIVYFDSRGPQSKNFDQYCVGDKGNNSACRNIIGIQKNWARFLKDKGINNHAAIAQNCIEYYSKKYGNLISGWWFDAGPDADYSSFSQAARTGNQSAAVAFNKHLSSGSLIAGYGAKGEKVFARALSVETMDEDYTAGHPTPMHYQSPNWEGNEAMIDSIRDWELSHNSVAHVFLPMQKGWAHGKPSFEAKQAADWTSRALRENGALTWAAAMKRNSSTIEEYQFRQLQSIDRAVIEHRTLIK